MVVNEIVFIDRDGTISEDNGFCCSPEEFKLLPNAGKAIKLLNDSGFIVILITNQSGVARGYYSEDTLKKIHQKMVNSLSKDGAKLDAIYYCPHLPSDNCECHKPKAGMVLKAIQDLKLNPTNCYVIGDKGSDIMVGRQLGYKTIGIGNDIRKDQLPDIEVKDILEAARFIIGESTIN